MESGKEFSDSDEDIINDNNEYFDNDEIIKDNVENNDDNVENVGEIRKYRRQAGRQSKFIYI